MQSWLLLHRYETRKFVFNFKSSPTKVVVPIGRGDTCLCFNCGVSINDWETDDCPWTEHGRLNKDCTYFILFNENLEDEFYHATLTEENKNAQIENNRNCKECLENEADAACLPCGHVSYCEECVEKHASCPVCENLFYYYIKIYVS